MSLIDIVKSSLSGIFFSNLLNFHKVGRRIKYHGNILYLLNGTLILMALH